MSLLLDALAAAVTKITKADREKIIQEVIWRFDFNEPSTTYQIKEDLGSLIRNYPIGKPEA